MKDMMGRVRSEFAVACAALFSLPTVVKVVLTMLLSVPAGTLILLDRLNALQARSLFALGGISSLVPKLPLSQSAVSEVDRSSALLHAAQNHLLLLLTIAACVGIYVIMGMWFTFGRFARKAALA